MNTDRIQMNEESARFNDTIFYVAIIRSHDILVKLELFKGNFDQVLNQLLPNITETKDHKMTLNYEDFSFHYILYDRIVYLCVTKITYDLKKAFQFLDKIKNKFVSTYEKRIHTALPFALNTEFSRIIYNEIQRYNVVAGLNLLTNLENETVETKDILRKNINDLCERGEHLHLLVGKTENLNVNSLSFKMSSRNLARSLYIKNCKLILIFTAAAFVIIYLIISMFCGSLNWRQC